MSEMAFISFPSPKIFFSLKPFQRKLTLLHGRSVIEVPVFLTLETVYFLKVDKKGHFFPVQKKKKNLKLSQCYLTCRLLILDFIISCSKSKTESLFAAFL